MILDFNNSFGKYHPLNPENSLKGFFSGTFSDTIKKLYLTRFTENIEYFV